MVDLRHPAIGSELAGGEPFDRVAAHDRRAALPHAIAAAQAVAYAHAHGVVHGRLSAACVLCGASGETIVTGWEHAGPADDPQATLVSEAPSMRRDRDDVIALRALVPLMDLDPIEAKTAAELAAALAAIHRRGVVRTALWPFVAGALALVTAAIVVGSSSPSGPKSLPRPPGDRISRARAVLATDPTRAIAELGRNNSPDTQMIAIEARTQGVATHVLTGLNHPPASVVWSPSGRTIAAADLDGVAVWHAETGHLRTERRFEHLQAPPGLRLSSEGNELAVFGTGLTTVWDLDNDATDALPVDDVVDLQTGSDRAFTLTRAGKLQVWDRAARDSRVAITDVRAFAVSDDRTRIVIALADGTVHLRKVTDLATDVKVWEPVGQLDSMLLLSDGGVTGIDDDGRAIWLTADGLIRSENQPGTLAIAPDGRTIVRRAGDTVKWTHDGVENTLSLPSVAAVAMSRNGAWIAVAGGRTAVIEVSTGAIHELRGQGGTTAVAFAPDNRRLATGGADASVRIWRLPDEAFGLGSHIDTALSPDGETLFATATTTTTMIDVDTGGRRVDKFATAQFAFSSTAAVLGAVPLVVRPLAGGDDIVLTPLDVPRAVAFSHDGTRVAAGDVAGGVQVWTLPNPIANILVPVDMVQSRREARTVAWSFDDRYLAVASDGDVDTWDAKTSEHARVSVDKEAVSIGWLPHDNKLVIAARAARQLQIWDAAADHSRRIELTGTLTANLAVSPDGDRVAVAFTDRTIRIWNVSTGEAPIVLLAPRVVAELAFHGDRLLSRDDSEITLWDLATGEHALVGESGGPLAVGGGKVVVHHGPKAVELVPIDDVSLPRTSATVDDQGLLSSSSAPSPSRPSSAGTGSSHL